MDVLDKPADPNEVELTEVDKKTYHLFCPLTMIA
jgi:hypothetical protein